MRTLKITAIILCTLFTSCKTHDTSASKSKNKSHQKLNTTEYDSTIFENAFYKLNSGDTLAQAIIDSFSKELDTRAEFYDLLAKFGKQGLFPNKYLSFEKAAESRLTSWLEYPTELDTIPSKIEMLKKVDYVENDTTFIYYVFQFKTDEPHWAAKDGWMVGVVGPYFKNSNPYDWPRGIFSKFSKMNETTPEKEVAWVHKNVYEKNSE